MSNLLPVTTILGCKNSMLREGLKHVLSSTRFKLHPESLSGDEITVGREDLDAPLLFILDAHLFPPRLTLGISSLKEQYPHARIVVLSDSFDLNDMKLVFRSGADGYCLATTGCEALIKYLDLVMLGEMIFPSAALLDALASDRHSADAWNEEPAISAPSAHASASFELKDSPVRTLSSREAEILQCLMHGAPNKVIARKLDVAEATVKVHIKAILRKIRVANRTQAAMWAVSHFSAGATDNLHLPSGEEVDTYHPR